MSRLSPLIPLMALTGWFVAGLVVYLVRARRDPSLEDAEVRARSASRLLGRTLRHFLMWMIRPWERGLVRLGVSPSAITMASLGVAGGAAVALGGGRFALGGWLYLGAGILDILDGRVARATGRVTRSGAYVDSVIDRYAELLVFAGLAFYYRGEWVLGVVLGAAIGSVMVSYARARGEALGVDVRVGTMQRPERLAWLGIVLAHSPLWEALAGAGGPHPRYWPAVIALGLLAVSSNLTAVRRILHTVRVLDLAPGRDATVAVAVIDPDPAPAAAPPAADPAAAADLVASADPAASPDPAGPTASAPSAVAATPARPPRRKDGVRLLDRLIIG